MAKITRYDGNLEAFASDATSTNRTIFGSENQSNDLTDNINTEFKGGWEIVGPNEAPTKQDFNALGYTTTQILSYLHQMGVAEWNATQEYHEGSVTTRSGSIYTSAANTNIGNDPASDETNWTFKTNLLDVNKILFNPISAPAHREGLLYYDNITKALSFYNDEAEVSLQLGEESWIKVCNNTGVTMTAPQIVYISGSDAVTGCPEVSLAQANNLPQSQTIAVVTHTIPDGETGYVTTFGLVRGLNTSAFAGGEIIYLSESVAGGVTTTQPSNRYYTVRIGYVGAADIAEGTFLVNIEHSGNISDVQGYDNVTNGLLEPATDAQMSFDNGTRTVTIEPQGSSFAYWSEGRRYDVTSADSIVIDDLEGLHYIYYNGDTLTTTQTWNVDIISKYAYVAAVYWDATNSKQLYLGDEYLHGIKMGPDTHAYLHNTRGFALESGGGLADILADESGDLDAHAQFSNDSTVAWDEDAPFAHAARLSTDNIAVYYKEGTEADYVWRVDETASFPVLTAGTGRAAFNELTGGSWQQTEATNGDFVLAHVFTYNDSARRFGIIQGENEYTTANGARDGAIAEIENISLDRVPVEEIQFLATIILQSFDVYANAVKSRIISTDSGADYIDLRSLGFVTGGSAGATENHSLLSNLSSDDHPQYVLADGTRAMDELTVDNISIDGNTISATGDLTLNPTGKTILEAASYSTLDTFSSSVNAFPAGTENSLIKANIKGLSTYNKTINGDFSNGTTGWASPETLTASNNILEIENTAGGDPVVVQNDMTTLSTTSDLIFCYIRYRVTAGSLTSIAAGMDGTTGGTLVYFDTVSSPTVGLWHEGYGILTVPSNWTGLDTLKIVIAGTVIGDTVEVDGTAGVFAVNMTKLGIADKTEAEMLDLVHNGYFEGLAHSYPGIETTHILAQQTILNGDFADGVSQWNNYNSTSSAASNILTTTGDGGLANTGINQVYTGFVRDGSTWFYSTRMRVTNSECDSLILFIAGLTAGNVTTPVINQWYEFSGIVTLPNDGVLVVHNLQHRYADAATANGKVMEIDGNAGVFVINMTATGIEDKTEAEMLEFIQNVGYFEGEKADISNSFNPNLTLRRLQDDTRDTLQNASDDLSEYLNNFKHTQRVSAGEAITSATVVNTTNFPSMFAGSAFMIELDAGGMQYGVDGDAASGDGTLYYELAQYVISDLTTDQLYSFTDGYLYQNGTLLNDIDYSLTQNIAARLDSLEYSVQEMDDKIASSIQRLTDDTTIAWDTSDSNNAVVTLEDNRTLGNPTNVAPGDSLKIIVKQDSTGSRTLAFDTAYKFPGGTAVTISTGANDVDVLEFFVEDSTNIYFTNSALDLS